jgi:hypothetical protein
MARIAGFRRPRPIPEVESEIAHLTEELSLTAAFVSAMERQGAYRAALGVLDEQQRRVASSERAMVAALAKPRTHRMHAALAGVAAVLMFASGAFAGYRAFGPDNTQHETLIHSASAKLAEAATASDPTQVEALVGQVHDELSSLAPGALSNTAMREDVQGLLEAELQLLAQRAPQASGLVQQVHTLAKSLKVEVKSPTPVPTAAPKPKTSPPPSEPSDPFAE